jgi:hypothetical protein
MCRVRSTAGTYKHVIVIFMENNSYTQIIGSASAPYIHSLASSCGLATNYHNISHPSLPNYIAVTDGGNLAAVTNPFDTDCAPATTPTCVSHSTNIFNQLNTGHRLWKGYAESMPSSCDRANAGFYAPRHNPAVYYTDLSNCANQDVPLGTTSSSPLLKDLSSEATAPAFSTVTPNLCDDMHGFPGCPADLIKTGDNFLHLWLPKITSTSVYKSGDTAVFITWDEGEGGSASTGENCATNTTDPSCRVVTIVVAPSVKPGRRVAKLLNHYSLLGTSEELLGLPKLGQAGSANSMVAPFNL